MKNGVYGGGKPGQGEMTKLRRSARLRRRRAGDRAQDCGRRRGGDRAQGCGDDGLAVYILFRTAGAGVRTATFFCGTAAQRFVERALVSRYREDIAYFSGVCGKAPQEEKGGDGLAQMAEVSGRRRVTSVFFGGGTPSLLSPGAVEAVLEELERHFDIVPWGRRFRWKLIRIRLNARNFWDSGRRELTGCRSACRR